MKYIKGLYIAAILFSSLVAKCQKPALDSTVWNNWPFIGAEPVISANGKFVIYAVENLPKNNRTLFIRELKKQKEVMIKGIATWDVKLAEDKLVYQIKDTLFILKLGENTPHVFYGVRNYILFKKGESDMLAFDNSESLIIYTLSGSEVLRIPSVNRYWLSSDRSTLVFNRNTKNEDSLFIREIDDKIDNFILSGTITDVKINQSGKQIAILTTTGYGTDESQSVWNYSKSTKVIQEIISSNSATLVKEDLIISGISRFSNDNKKLFFYLRKKKHSERDQQGVMLDIWSYTDMFLQTQQMQMGPCPDYLAIININGSNYQRITEDNERLYLNDEMKQDSILPVRYQIGSNIEADWNPRFKSESYIVNTATGRKNKLAKTLNPITMYSPAGRFFLNFDSANSNIYTYDLFTGKENNLTEFLAIPDTEDVDGLPRKKYARGLIPSGYWLPNDSGIIIYDKYDIWLIDPTATRTPKNLTKGYGRQHKIQFRFAGIPDMQKVLTTSCFYLAGFNTLNKDIGFYKISLKKNKNPQLLSNGPYYYDVLLAGNPIIKAKRKNIYIVLRYNEREGPNLYLTKNFIRFKPITNIHPEKNWNWINVELKSFYADNGTLLQGLLYKPDNFDAQKKYPVILTYYEKMSDGMHKYLIPGPTNTLLNIPWFVSQGYLIFCPDISFTTGLTGKCALSSIMGATTMLKRLPYVDSTHIGLQGHSFSGFETNYIITKTSFFKAAVSGAGPTDLISSYGTILGQGGDNGAEFLERSQTRIGASPWDRMDLYIENSPIFNVDKVTTPLLMVHSKKDGLVPFSQGLEFFIGLRRMNKRVWLLQYDNSDHHIIGSDAIDYTIRIEQFFNYYLKGIPEAPIWMTQGIPFRMKGITRGLDNEKANILP